MTYPRAMAAQLVATDVLVRDLRDADELRAAQAIQRRAWGITEDGYLVPVATMSAAQKVGGLVLGAFQPNSTRLVGFSFAFLGRLRGQLILYSQLTGVDPAIQSSGVGRQLKYEQRRRAREMGIDSIVWAFDPLQASNASFNLSVLGAISRTYEVDLYGSRTDALNAGLATDRLLAEWSTHQADERPRADLEAWTDAPDLVAATDAIGTPRLRLSVPADLAAAKAAGTAGTWQQHVRAAFQSAFGAGYVAVGFVRGVQPAYLLERQA